MRFFKPIILGLLLAGSAVASDALINRLHPRGLVNDYANVIPAAQERQLAALLTELQQRTGDPIAVVTLPSLDGGQIDDFTIRLAERWGIGQKGKDNGILFLGATNERRGNRLRIEVGYGLEGVINDAMAGRILDETVVPAWNQRQYGTAMVNGGIAIAQRIAADRGVTLSGMPQNSYGHSSQQPRKSNPFLNIIFIIGFIYMAIRHPRLLLLLMMTSGRGGGSRGGGGFGGGGFGGGGFGGGGASR